MWRGLGDRHWQFNIPRVGWGFVLYLSAYDNYYWAIRLYGPGGVMSDYNFAQGLAESPEEGMGRVEDILGLVDEVD